MKKQFFTLVLLVACLSSHAFKVVGYLPTYRFGNINSIDFSKLTHVMPSFANPNVNGEFEFSTSLTNLVTKAHAANCEVFISIGGGGLSSTIENYYISETVASKRPAFINSLMNLVRSNDLDGIDIDLEAGLMSMSTYNDFVQDLIDSAHAEGKQVSAAFAQYTGGNVNQTTVQKLDFINSMSYDVTGPWTPNSPGQHSPMSKMTSDFAYWKNKGAQAKDVVLGVPFYGYEFKTDKSVVAHTYCGIIGAYPSAASQDEVNTGDGTIYYNGTTTIEAKTQYAIDNGAGGIMIWELGQDCFDGSSLLNIIVNKMLNNNMHVGVSEANEISINVFPNPATESVQIQNGFDGVLKVYNVLGHLIFNHEGPIDQINVSAWKAGYYNLVFQNDSGEAIKTVVKK